MESTGKVFIAGALHSVDTTHIVAYTGDLHDVEFGKRQSVINKLFKDNFNKVENRFTAIDNSITSINAKLSAEEIAIKSILNDIKTINTDLIRLHNVDEEYGEDIMTLYDDVYEIKLFYRDLDVNIDNLNTSITDLNASVSDIQAVLDEKPWKTETPETTSFPHEFMSLEQYESLEPLANVTYFIYEDEGSEDQPVVPPTPSSNTKLDGNTIVSSYTLVGNVLNIDGTLENNILTL